MTHSNQLGRLIAEHTKFQEELALARKRIEHLERGLLECYSTPELKRLWDREEPGDEFIDVDAIHAELNRRGEGVYCTA